MKIDQQWLDATKARLAHCGVQGRRTRTGYRMFHMIVIDEVTYRIAAPNKERALDIAALAVINGTINSHKD